MTGQSETESDSIEVKQLSDINHKHKSKRSSQFVCSYDDCKAIFKRSDHLKRHLRQHSGERPYVCHIGDCLRSFVCKSYLTKHLKRPHNMTEEPKKEKKQYICGECGKGFKSKFQLKTHSFQHSGQKPFECDKCEKHFATRTKLKSHLKTHNGYACGREGCDFIASKWTELRKHIVIHNVLKCDICGKMFNNGSNLSAHKETIHLNPSLKFVCTYDECNKSYTKKSNLMAHIRAQHKKQLFQCSHDGCDKTFCHKKTLTLHLDNHSNPKPEKIKIKKQKKTIKQRVSESTKLTGIETIDCDVKQMPEIDANLHSSEKLVAKQ